MSGLGLAIFIVIMSMGSLYRSMKEKDRPDVDGAIRDMKIAIDNREEI